jgi:hypothetical protein
MTQAIITRRQSLAVFTKLCSIFPNCQLSEFGTDLCFNISSSLLVSNLCGFYLAVHNNRVL